MTLFHHFLLNLGTLYIVWSGVSPGSKLCATFINIAKYFKTLRCGWVYFFNLLKTSTDIWQLRVTIPAKYYSPALNHRNGFVYWLWPFIKLYKIVIISGRIMLRIKLEIVISLQFLICNVSLKTLKSEKNKCNYYCLKRKCVKCSVSHDFVNSVYANRKEYI